MTFVLKTPNLFARLASAASEPASWRSPLRTLRAAIAGRSSRWPAVETAHLRAEPVCRGCGTKKHLQVHHKKPFHLHPELELDPKNLITLCMDVWRCHIELGHSGDWKAYNPHVEDDADLRIERIQTRKYAA